MAKSGNKNKTVKTQAVTDRSYFYTDLTSLLPESKNELWAAQSLFWAKKNSRQFLSPERAKKYRALDSLIVNEKDLKEMIDPITPKGSGGDAKYFSSDGKALPIYLHLKNIAKANIEKTFKQFEVNLVDKFAKTRKMQESYKILSQNLFRQIINTYNEEAGLPTISESQDPYKWVESLEGNFNEKQGGAGPIDSVVDYLSLIRNQIQDSQDLAIYNELIYKGDYEIAFELGIKHYLINLNEWAVKNESFLDDIMHFNKAAGQWYTDEETGRPHLDYVIPEELFTNPYKTKNGRDLMYYYYEYEVNWADFMRQIGVTLTDEQLKNVFEYHKSQGRLSGFTNVAWQGRATRVADSAIIRIGRMSILTQNMDSNLDVIPATYPNYQGVANSWDAINPEEEVQERVANNKIYNVWYSFFYIPPSSNAYSNADYLWQAQFIFNLKKNQDQLRYGDNGRYSQCPLVIYDNSTQASFTDVVEGFKSKMDFLWQKYQNFIINDIDAAAISDDFIAGMLNAVDESNGINNGNVQKGKPNGGNGPDAYMEMWKMVKQGNTGFLRMTDKNGNPLVDPSKFIVRIQNFGLENAAECISQIMLLYQTMTNSLSFNDITEGMNIKPRTPVEGIQEAVDSSNKARWFIEKTYEMFFKLNAERVVQYILMIAKEPGKFGYHERWEEFKGIIGEANGLMVEGLKDIPAETVGFKVDYVDNASKREFVTQLALQAVRAKELDEAVLYLIMGVDNWKYALALMRMGMNKRKREVAEQEELAHQRQMELVQQQQQLAAMLQQQKVEGNIAEINAQAQATAQIQAQLNDLKAQTQAMLKELTTQGRMREQNNKAQLESQAQNTVPFENISVPQVEEA